jgi:hypothetical protein
VKFVLHAGLAFGAFHRYIYKPFKAGAPGLRGSARATRSREGIDSVAIRAAPAGAGDSPAPGSCLATPAQRTTARARELVDHQVV